MKDLFAGRNSMTDTQWDDNDVNSPNPCQTEKHTSHASHVHVQATINHHYKCISQGLMFVGIVRQKMNSLLKHEAVLRIQINTRHPGVEQFPPGTMIEIRCSRTNCNTLRSKRTGCNHTLGDSNVRCGGDSDVFFLLGVTQENWMLM